MAEGIDRTTLKGELYKSIESALKATFENVYPGYEIEIQYRTERKEGNRRYFYVYLKGETFNVRDEIPMLKEHLVYVDRFVNSDAIVFSEHSREDFEKENDCKEENMDIIKEAIEKAKEEFKDKGTFKRAEVHNRGYRLCFDVNVPEGKRLRNSWYKEVDVSHYFYTYPISTKTAKAHASKIRTGIKHGIERVESECSKGY